MSAAREALGVLNALAKVLPNGRGMPADSRCERLAPLPPAADRLPALPARDVLETLRRELREACRGPGASSLPRRTLRQAPLVLWLGEEQAAAFEGLLPTFLRQAGQLRGWLGPLIEAWLRDFGPDRINHAATGVRIAQRLEAAAPARLMIWRDAHRAFRMFDAAAGPAGIAEALLHSGQGVPEVLRSTGMDDPLRASGRYFRACVTALLAGLPSALRRPDAEKAWERAAMVLQGSRAERDGRGRTMTSPELRFADLAGKTARACLTPWLSGPAPAMPRDAVKTFLVGNIGDPRLQSSKWTAAGEEATAMMRRWLAEATLDAFFALIRQRNDDVQWRFREKFWRACLAKRREAEVWVVLGQGLAGWAKTLPALNKSFGLMEGSNAQDQAVLLFRIGGLVCSEWSNVGPVRAYDATDRNCPPLYRSRYDAADLRAPCLPFPGAPHGSGGLRHDSPARYLWQSRAAALLAAKTGLQLKVADYRWP